MRGQGFGPARSCGTRLLCEAVGTTDDDRDRYYGVAAGSKIRLLVFSLDIPGVIWPGLLNRDTEAPPK